MEEKKPVANPCPFCGKKPSVVEGWGAPAGVGTAWSCWITCENRKCRVKPQYSTYTTKWVSDQRKLKKETIERWNIRA